MSNACHPFLQCFFTSIWHCRTSEVNHHSHTNILLSLDLKSLSSLNSSLLHQPKSVKEKLNMPCRLILGNFKSWRAKSMIKAWRLSTNCCVFRPAFGCCVQPKAGRNTFLQKHSFCSISICYKRLAWLWRYLDTTPTWLNVGQKDGLK